MKVIEMSKRLKQVHPKTVLIFKAGSFYNTYGKDAYIIGANFYYTVKTTNNTPNCGFSNGALAKVKKLLEDKKINYKIILPSNNYEVEEESDYKNLNKYDKELQISYPKIKNHILIDKIKERLELIIENKNFKIIIRKIEDMLDEDGEI